MEKIKKKLIICAALLLACVAYQFIFNQFLHIYYARFEPIGTYAHYLLMFVTEPFKYFLIGVIVVLLYQNIFTEAPQLPSKLKPICKIASGLLVLVYLAVVIIWRCKVYNKYVRKIRNKNVQLI